MSGGVKQVSRKTDVDERLSALLTNASAVAALASAVEGTLGPKGLDCMLVDKFGDVTVTNDGATILDRIDTSHPAARMLIKAARAQEEEVGDGTTTTAILASALIAEGAAHVSRGVPVTRVIEGMRLGVEEAVRCLQAKTAAVGSLDDEVLYRVALIAARGHADIASLVVEAARMIGERELRDPGRKLSDSVIAKEGTENAVFRGVVLDKQRVNRQMPACVEAAQVLVVDDALEPPQIEDDALATESGFARHLALADEFKARIERLIAAGVRFVAVARSIDPVAEELFTEAGVFCVRRLCARDVARLAELTGARTVKRSGINRDAEELAGFLGSCERVYEDERLDHIRVVGGPGACLATVIVGASTREVRDERQRIAQDAAGAVQAAVRSGVVPGGGAIEMAAARRVQALRETVRGMTAYGVEAVAAALKRPLSQIIANAGFNPLEKVEDVLAAQAASDDCALAVDCDTGEVADMKTLGVVDPAGVKLYALRAASEIAEAILRINTIIRKRDEADSASVPASARADAGGTASQSTLQ